MKNLNIVPDLYSRWTSPKCKSECCHLTQLLRFCCLSSSVYRRAQECTLLFLLLSSRPTDKATLRDSVCRRTSAIEGQLHCSDSHFPLQTTNLRVTTCLDGHTATPPSFARFPFTNRIKDTPQWIFPEKCKVLSVTWK